MGAMQAQDFGMAKWAVGLRIPAATEGTFDEAFNKGEILRTHVMRPTWHLVSAQDIRWMLELSAPHIRTSLKSRHRELEITNDVLRKSINLIVKALQNNNHTTREELIRIFERNNIDPGNNRASHLLLCAEMDGILCSGAIREGKPTYALLDERIPRSRSITRPEALQRLALKYFSSHGPATLQDFVWWSGLPVADARSAVEMIKPDLMEDKIGERVYWMHDSTSVSGPAEASVVLLPAYDEFIISYKDRTVSLTRDDISKAVSSNGIFRPVILINGRVIGLWRKSRINGRLHLDLQFFRKPDKSTRSLVKSAIQSYESFNHPGRVGVP
jgi:hypothetical protein